jgi:hypothetical protein
MSQRTEEESGFGARVHVTKLSATPPPEPNKERAAFAPVRFRIAVGSHVSGRRLRVY